MASDGPDHPQKIKSQLLADVLQTDTWPAAPLSGNGQEIGPLLDCSRWQLRQFRRHRQGERRRARGHPAAFSTRTTTRETGILQLNVHQRRCILGVLRQAAPSHAPAGGAPLAAKGPSEVGVRVPVAGRRRDHPSGAPAVAKLIKSTWRRPQGEHQSQLAPAPKCPLIPAPGTFIHPSLKCLSIPPCTPPVTGLTRLGLPRPFAMDADLTVVSTTVAPAFVSALPPPSHRRRRHRCRHHRRRRRRRHRCRCRHRCRRTSSRRLLTATTTATLRPPPPSRRCRSR